jgi:hypothetical protein
VAPVGAGRHTDQFARVDWNVSVDSSIVRAHLQSATAKRSARKDRTVLVEHTGAVSNEMVTIL